MRIPHIYFKRWPSGLGAWTVRAHGVPFKKRCKKEHELWKKAYGRCALLNYLEGNLRA